MIYKLPDKLQNAISELIDTKQSRKIAESVLRLSDFYIDNPSGSTPWSESWVQLAYFGYYLPLNFLRAQRVFQEAERFGFFNDVEQIVDFGSGLGSGSLPFLLKYPNTQALFVEHSELTHRLHESVLDKLNLNSKKYEWDTEIRSTNKKTLGIFSYSLTEIKNLPTVALKYDKLMIIEPSTQDDGRSLMQLREELLEMGWHVQAPCTHAGRCPLLHQSKTDWCHDRAHIELPEWMKQVEAHLPFKNQTLTFSYLLLSKSPVKPTTNQARLVGDQLIEKGKTRQLVCRNEEREYLSWLDRHGKPEELFRGELIDWPAGGEKKGNEIRLTAKIKT